MSQKEKIINTNYQNESVVIQTLKDFKANDFIILSGLNMISENEKEIAAKHDVQNRKNMIITLKNCIAEEQYQIIQLEEELYNML